jgi:hypothetical protein
MTEKSFRVRYPRKIPSFSPVFLSLLLAFVAPLTPYGGNLKSECQAQLTCPQ